MDSWGLAYAARTTRDERRSCKETFGRWEQQAKKEKAAWLKKREEKAQARKRAELLEAAKASTKPKSMRLPVLKPDQYQGRTQKILKIDA